jgi:hypothetical protein
VTDTAVELNMNNSDSETDPKSRSSPSAESNDSTGGTATEEVSDQADLNLLAIGSTRPNFEDGDNAGIRIRATIENADGTVENYDAAIFTGLVRPTPHHERFNPGGLFDELTDQLMPIARKIPTYFVTGNYGFGDPLETIYDRDHYAPSEQHDPFTTAPTNHLQYIPIQGTTSLGEYSLTQNPRIAASEDNCLLVTPDLYPELWDDHKATALLAGGQLTGRWIGDSLAPTYVVENIGPMRPDSAGAVHRIAVNTDGILSHEYLPLSDIELVSCNRHLDRGLQYVHEGQGCIFCHNEDRYFEEWVRAGVRSVRKNSEYSLKRILEAVSERGHFSPDQAERFEKYLDEKLAADSLGFDGRGPGIDVRRSPDSPLISDPRDVYDQASLLAGEELRIPSHERAEYFHRFDVHDAGSMREQFEFEEVQPPTPGDIDEAHAELDRAAYDRGVLQGEWVVFPRSRAIGALWEDVLEHVDSGDLYDAQVSTAWHKTQRGERTERHFLGVAVPNYFDHEDVFRVGDLITDENIVGDGAIFFFKPLLYTMLGINQSNAAQYGLEQSSRYRYSDLLTMQND